MSNGGRQRAAQRYRTALYNAQQAAISTLADTVSADFNLSGLTNRAVEAWSAQWVNNNRQPPNGGWDWAEIRNNYRSKIDKFEAAVWSDQTLSGLSIGCVNHTAVMVDAIEGHPSPSNPLKGQVLLIVLQAATCYAQALGREELWLMEPAGGLIPLYTETYGFSLEKTRQGTPYCRRRIA